MRVQFVSAKEDAFSANWIMTGCLAVVANPGGVSFREGLCLGIVSTIPSADEKTCVPPQATNQQMVRVVVQYIDARPARLHEPFQDLALEALRATWPCLR